jgi:hypothetical protein
MTSATGPKVEVRETQAAATTVPRRASPRSDIDPGSLGHQCAFERDFLTEYVVKASTSFAQLARLSEALRGIASTRFHRVWDQKPSEEPRLQCNDAAHLTMKCRFVRQLAA